MNNVGGEINPPLNVPSNANYIVKIQKPTNAPEAYSNEESYQSNVLVST